jgi:hypothetical protein
MSSNFSHLCEIPVRTPIIEWKRHVRESIHGESGRMVSSIDLRIPGQEENDYATSLTPDG